METGNDLLRNCGVPTQELCGDYRTENFESLFLLSGTRPDFYL